MVERKKIKAVITVSKNRIRISQTPIDDDEEHFVFIGYLEDVNKWIDEQIREIKKTQPRASE